MLTDEASAEVKETGIATGDRGPAPNKTGREKLALILALVALATIIIFRVSEDVYESSASLTVSRADHASEMVEHLMTMLFEAETGQRGFLITSDPFYLSPYRDAVRQLPGILREFESATAAIPLGRDESKRVQQLAVRKIDELQETVRLAAGRHKDVATSIVSSGRGNRIMQDFRLTAASLQRKYRAYALQQENDVRARRKRAFFVTSLGSLLAAFILIWAGLRLQNVYRQQSRLLREMEENQVQYRRLADRLQVVREEERAHLAREIHDILGQALTGIKLDLVSIRSRIEKGDQPGAVGKIGEGLETADETIRLLRKIASELRPPLLDHIGLFAALRVLAEEFSARTGIKCSLQGQDVRLPITDDQRIALYRIVQESFTNVARHSEAQHVSLTALSDGEVFHIRVEDDGKGFDPEKTKSSLGLIGIRERARLIGAAISIGSIPGAGTTVEVSLPLRPIHG